MKRSNGFDPHQKLMNFLLCYRSTPHSTTNTTPSELFLHQSLRTRLDLLRPELGVAVSQKQAEQKKYHDLHSRNRNFFIGERVLVRNMRNSPRWLLGTITEWRGPLSYLVQVANGVVWKRHVDHLRKTIDSPAHRRKILFQRLLMNLQLLCYYKSHQLFTQMKEVLLFLLPVIQFLSSQKDQRLLLCQLKTLSLTLLPYLLDVTLNVFADHPNNFMNNTCEFMRKRKRFL